MTATWEWYGPDAIPGAVGYEDLIEPVAAALADYSHGFGESPAVAFAPPGRDGDVQVKSAWLPGRDVRSRWRRDSGSVRATAGRRHDLEITIRKRVGLGVRDLAAAELTLTRVRDHASVPSRLPASVRDLFQETR